MIEPRIYSVLLIEDEQSSYEYIFSLLSVSRPDTYDLTWISTYDAVIATLNKNHFDVCLLDYQLGSYSGLDVLNLFSDNGIRIPVIMLTGHGNIRVDVEAQDLGAVDYFDKSHIRAASLTRAIRYAVQMHEERIQLETVNAQLRDLEEKRTKLLADFAHDIRSPISALLLKLDLMERQPEQLERYITDMRRQISRLQSMLRSIHDTERLNGNSAIYDTAEVNMVEVIKSVADAHSDLANEKGLMLELDVPPHAPPVTGSHNQLTQAVDNLVGNAIKYTQEGKVSIQLNELAEQQKLSLVVTDTGIGIARVDIPHIFKRFYRTEDVQQSTITGTGLGLSIVQEIVLLHEGEIHVSSEPGVGSTFMIKLPITSTQD